jgi:hypothetical protein
MSWKRSVVRGAAIAWAIILIGAFVVFAGVSIMMPSTKSSRIKFDPKLQREGLAPIAVEAPATQPA